MTWLPAAPVACVESASVRDSTGSDAPLMQSGELNVTGYVPVGYYRVEMLGSDGMLVDVATLLFEPDGREYSHRVWGGSIAGRSVLAPAADLMMEPGSYAPKGVDGASWVARLLRECVPAPVSVAGSCCLSDHVVFDLGDSRLDAAWKVLEAIGYCMQISGDGTVTVREIPSTPKASVNERSGLLLPSIGQSLPIADVPNVMRVYDEGSEAIARNDDPSSPTSTVSRGRAIECVEDSPIRREGETLQQYADRRLAELSDVCETLDVEREWADMGTYDIWHVNLPTAGLSGNYRIIDKATECTTGIKVGETWGRMA